MLERIINITPGSDYNRASRNPKYGKKFSLYTNFQSGSSNDSIQISPATAYLAHIKWKLKKFSNDQEKMGIVFEFDGFEFVTHFSLGEIVQLNRIDYDVMKEIENLGNLVKVSSKMSVLLNEHSDQNIFIEHMNYLSEFYSRLMNSGLRKPSIITDVSMLRNMTVDIYKELTGEFNYINSCLLRFIEKYSSQKISVPLKSGTDETELIIKSVNLG